MATTTNFGWDTPDDTDYVTDGAAAMRELGQDIDTTLVDLKGGTTGQMLTKATNTDMDFAWVTPNPGDITGISATTPLTGGGTSGDVTLGIQDGTTAQKGAVQLEDSISSTSTTKAATPNSVKSAYDLANNGGPAFRAFRGTSNQTFSQNTWTKIQFNAESFDTASCYDSTTNYRFTPNKAGYYQINVAPWLERSGTGLIYLALQRNGAEVSINGIRTGEATWTPNLSDLIYLNGSTDYIEIYIYDQAVTSRAITWAGGTQSYFSGVWIRS